MVQTRAAFGPIGSVAGRLSHRLRAGLANVRLVVALSLLLICGSFIAAALIQMRLDRSHALAQAAYFSARRAQEMATDIDAEFDRFRAIGTAFASAETSAETSAALSEAAGPALGNVVVLDSNGQIRSEMKGAPRGFLPLSPDALKSAQGENTILPASDGRSFALVFAAGEGLVTVQLKARLLLPGATMRDGLLATPSGRILAVGERWSAVPGMTTLALGGDTSASRIVDLAGGPKLISLRRLTEWPLIVGSSLPVEEALDAWYGALPLYLFIILGPALSGAGLAFVFVREFERQARMADALRSLRDKRPSEARLLVRLAEAEKHAIEAERAKTQFTAQMSHELRTPLNAIIGFSEVIEQGLFGPPGHPKYVEYAHDIAIAGRELHAKIGAVLDFADLQSGRCSLRTKPVDLTRIARESAAAVADVARVHGINLIVSMPAQVEANADADAVRRILDNILANALQYTPAGGEVRLGLRAENGGIVVDVSDTGRGFSTDERARAGQPFQRFDRPGAIAGVGLGLAAAMGLARKMGGNLRLCGALGGGTRAELHLPGVNEAADAEFRGQNSEIRMRSSRAK